MNSIAIHASTVQAGPGHGKTANDSAPFLSPPALPPAKLDLMLRRNEDVVVVDVRDAELYEQGHVPGAINVPLHEWQACERLCDDALNIVYDGSPNCQLAGRAARAFARKGYEVMEMSGGFEAWEANHFEIDAL